ncbi:carbonic anhydrase family protein [Wandonia haliotis]|uniref:Carbonic anhydrase family protein n=2 Tax=Wandonia haliotis TaxID=574963 RepID=A0ABN1MS84_9FLAO
MNMRAHTKETQSTITPERALEILKEGNQRFVENLSVDRDLLKQMNDTRDGQWPFAGILSCMDSRTSAELIFDQGLGDIFSIRIAGNVVNSDILGSLEYAVKGAGSKLIVVLGHTRCGAVTGACNHVEMGNLTSLLSKIQPAIYEERTILEAEKRTGSNPDFVQKVADINVKRSVKAVIERSMVIEQMIRHGEIGVIGAMYDVVKGTVEFFDDTFVCCERTLNDMFPVTK